MNPKSHFQPDLYDSKKKRSMSKLVQNTITGASPPPPSQPQSHTPRVKAHLQKHHLILRTIQFTVVIQFWWEFAYKVVTYRLEYRLDFFSKRSYAAFHELTMMIDEPAASTWRMSESKREW